jgi:hypothetical protein
MCALKGVYDNLVAITVRDVGSCSAPPPGSDRHTCSTGPPAVIQSTPVPPTTLGRLPGSLALCLCSTVVTRCSGLLAKL